MRSSQCENGIRFLRWAIFVPRALPTLVPTRTATSDRIRAFDVGVVEPITFRYGISGSLGEDLDGSALAAFSFFTRRVFSSSANTPAICGMALPARDRKKAEIGKCGGRYSMLERNPYIVKAAKELATERHMSLQEVADALHAKGITSKSETPFNKTAVQRMLAVTWPDVERGIAAYEKRNQGVAEARR